MPPFLIDTNPTTYLFVPGCTGSGGVVPDDPKVKTVTRAYDRIAANPDSCFFGNVEFHADVMLEGLKDHYLQVIFSTSAQTAHDMGISGGNPQGS